MSVSNKQAFPFYQIASSGPGQQGLSHPVFHCCAIRGAGILLKP
jgi:hypothetical protein